MALLRKYNPDAFAGAANSWSQMPISPDYEPDNSPVAPDITPTNARSSVSALTPSISASQPDVVRDIYQPQLRDISSRLQDAYTPPDVGTGGKIRQIFGALVSQRNPQLGAIISGDFGRMRQINALQNQYKLIEDAIAQNRATNMNQFDIAQRIANLNKTQAETERIPVQQKLEQAQAEAANYKEDPNLGLIDLRTKQPVNDTALAPLSQAEADVLGKNAGDRVPLKLKNTANEIAMRGHTTLNTEEGVFDYNRQSGEKTRLGSNPKMMFAPENRIVAAGMDPDNPGALTYVHAGDALKQGAAAPGSASVQAAKGVLKSATSGKIGEEVNAFNTAIAHADLLNDAAKALNNGNVQALNGLKNQFSNAFGSSGPVTAQAIADAYTREVTKMLSSGHLTDAEISTIGKTLNPNKQNLAQVQGVLNAYKALSQSKLKMRQQQVEQGLQGKVNFPENQTPVSSIPTFSEFQKGRTQ